MKPKAPRYALEIQHMRAGDGIYVNTRGRKKLPGDPANGIIKSIKRISPVYFLVAVECDGKTITSRNAGTSRFRVSEEAYQQHQATIGGNPPHAPRA